MIRDEPLRPPEFRAELTRLNAEDLSSSSSDEELKLSRRELILKQNAKKSPRIKKGLPPSGKAFSGSVSVDGLRRESVKRESITNGSSLKSNTLSPNVIINESENKNLQNGSQLKNINLQENNKSLPPIYKTTVRCLMSSDKCSIKRQSPSKTVIPFVFSGPKRSNLVQEIKVQCEPGKMPFTLSGGAEYGKLLSVNTILHPDLLNKLHEGDILLSANKLLLSGKTQIEVITFILSIFGANNPLEIEFVREGQIPIEISEIFANKKWVNLHVVIRDNALLYTCQYTTRLQQPNEINGQDYQFIEVDEFHSLCNKNFFLEWTENSDGHLYGTPKPPIVQLEEPEKENDKIVEAKMVHNNDLNGSPSFLRGPLPKNWEIAYTELGEKYFIDHNSGTTHWNDPREQLPNKRSSAVEFSNHRLEDGNQEDEELPEGWERIDDENHGTFYVDHINKRTQYERPEFPHKSETMPRNGHYSSTGITTSTAKRQPPSSSSLPPEPAYPPPIHHSNTQPSNHHHPGDYPSPSPSNLQPIQNQQNGHYAMWNGGGRVSPSTKKRSTVGHQFTTDPSQLKGELLTTRLYKGPTGFGFTLIGNDGGNAAPEFIQIKSILPNGPAALDNVLHTGDLLVYVDNDCMLGASQDDACGLLRSIPPGESVTLQVCRGYPLVLDPTNKIINLGQIYTPNNIYVPSNKSHDQLQIVITKGPKGFGFTITDSPQGQRVKSILYPDQCPNLFENDLILEVDGHNALPLNHAQLVQLLQDFPVGYQTKLVISRHSPKNRSRTPTAGFRFGEKNRTTPLPILPRSKTPAPQQSRNYRQPQFGASGNTTVPRSYGTSRNEKIYEELSRVRLNSDPYAQNGHHNHYNSTQLATPNYIPLSALTPANNTPLLFGSDSKYQLTTVNLLRKADGFGFRLVGGLEMGTPLQVGSLIKGGAAYQDGRLREGDEIVEINDQNVIDGRHDVAVNMIKHAAHLGHVKLIVRRLKDTWTNGYNNYTSTFTDYGPERPQSSQTYDVHLVKHPNEDFGCTLVTIEHRFIGRIIPGTPAERCGRLRAGDCIAMINGFSTSHMTHRQVIDYIKSCGNQVTFTIDPTIVMPRYAAPQQNGTTTIGKPIESEDAIYTTTNDYGSLTQNGHNGINSQTHYQSNGNIVMGTGLDYLNEEDKDFKLLTVELSRGPKNFGFSIRGGFEFGRMPLFILRIADDGPAAEEGSLRVGDQLVEINGEDTTGMTHERAISLIREQPTVRLVIKRKLLA